MPRPSLSAREIVDWLRLARAEAVGPVTFNRLLERYATPARALEALPEVARRGGRAQPLAIPTAADAERELAAGEALGARLICAADPAFPRLLLELDPRPPLIWTLGDADLLRPRAVGIVGARVASAAGRRFAQGLAADLGRAGYAVVSGMARGIDAAAHEGALPYGTVAVLGGGIDDIYPPENAGLHAQLAARGCIVSESAPGRRAQAQDFPRRNRIISGLSLGVVVVEAELKSGSLITARQAGEQGREVFAVPGSPLDPRARGANDLIRQGATLVESAEDVLAVLNGLRGLADPEPPAYQGAGAAPDDGDVDAVRERLAGLLSPTPMPIDELARQSGAPTPIVLAALMELALAGRAELLPGALAVAG
ncbi:DNA-processing protein DprA [Caulobacter sp. KR2-114]|uniref:DNA-processing protein DprA n=1 Tax=Caulobacter sp. KR2-114 TaxID=3400912 RepID=UPI003BFF184A